jgi:hypothetical protein
MAWKASGRKRGWPWRKSKDLLRWGTSHGESVHGRRHHGSLRRADRARGPCATCLLCGALPSARAVALRRRGAPRARSRVIGPHGTQLRRGRGREDRRRSPHGLRSRRAAVTAVVAAVTPRAPDRAGARGGRAVRADCRAAAAPGRRSAGSWSPRRRRTARRGAGAHGGDRRGARARRIVQRGGERHLGKPHAARGRGDALTACPRRRPRRAPRCGPPDTRARRAPPRRRLRGAVRIDGRRSASPRSARRDPRARASRTSGAPAS